MELDIRQRYSLTIDGKAAAAGTTTDVLNPADGSVVAACPQGDVNLLDQAVAAASRALPGWSARPDAERVAALNGIADLLEQHAGELATLLTREQGKTQSGPGANLEAGACVAWTRVTAGLTLPEQTIQDDPTGRIVVRRKPVGVVGSITPWNWPLMIATWHVGRAGRLHRRHQTLAIYPALDPAPGRADEPGPPARRRQRGDR